VAWFRAKDGTKGDEGQPCDKQGRLAAKRGILGGFSG